MVGNFSPHEAFAIGGTNSVRGYEEGAVGSGRSHVVGSGEISFPLVRMELFDFIDLRFWNIIRLYFVITGLLFLCGSFPCQAKIFF